jgi:Xaa-Pro aminopeptidase
VSRELFTAQELDEFRTAQRLAYDATAAVEAMLYEGITEKQAAALLERSLRDRGVTRFFHYGFAWFGERTTFAGFAPPSPNALNDLLNPKMAHFGKQFQPTDRPLRRGDAVILDVGPIYGRASSDMGYSCTLGEPSVEIHEARMALQPYRSLVLDMVKAGDPQNRIYRAVDELIADQGFRSVHAAYPGSVIAHRVGRVPGLRLPTFNMKGFSPQAITYLAGEVLASAVRPRVSAPPVWNDDCDRPCEPGLWAVEPHIGKCDIGVKWEELLVVTDDDAYWLDDDLPHVRYWAEHSGANRS